MPQVVRFRSASMVVSIGCRHACTVLTLVLLGGLACAADQAGSGSQSPAGQRQVRSITAPDDSRWSAGGLSFSGVDNPVACMINDVSGNMIVGGDFRMAGDVPANHIASWDGSSWSTLGAGCNDEVQALALSPSGTIYAAGLFTEAGTTQANGIAAWDGSQWNALGSGPTGSIRALAVDAVGNLYAGGTISLDGGTTYCNVAEWNGSAWTAVGGGLPGQVNSLAFDGSGQLYAGGDLSPPLAAVVAVLEAGTWHNAGVSWAMATLLEPSVAPVTSMVCDSTGAIVVAANSGLGTSGYVLQGPSWSQVADAHTQFTSITTVAAGSGGELVAFGDTNTGFQMVSSWSPGDASWTDLSYLINIFSNQSLLVDARNHIDFGGECVYAESFLPVYAQGLPSYLTELYPNLQGFGGVFSELKDVVVDADGSLTVSANQAGAIQTGSSPPGDLALVTAPGSLGAVPGGLEGTTYSLVHLSDGTLVAGGNDLSAGGSPPTGVMALRSGTWTAMGSAPQVAQLAVDAADHLFCCTTGSGAGTALQWDGGAGSWSDLGLVGQVQAITADGLGGCWAAGTFTGFGSPDLSIMHWDGQGWTELTQIFWQRGTPAVVNHMTVTAAGTLLIAGGFNVVGTLNVNNVAAWDGSSWSTLGGGCDDTVEDIAADQGFVYATGFFLNAGGVAASGIAVWNGATWFPLGSGLSYQLGTRLAFDAGHDLVVAGNFSFAGGQPSPMLATWLAPTPATLVLGGLSQLATGQPLPVQISTTPANIAISITYNGLATPPSAPGTYAVVATVIDPSFAGQAHGSLVITAASSGTSASTTTATTGTGTAATASATSGVATGSGTGSGSGASAGGGGCGLGSGLALCMAVLMRRWYRRQGTPRAGNNRPPGPG